jgi:hypothetical protein
MAKRARRTHNPTFKAKVADYDEGGHLFRSQGGHHYDLMPATLTI